MHSQNLQTEIIDAVSKHIVSSLITLYKRAGVGDNRLELGEHSITYSDGAEYEITAIEMDFSIGQPGELIFHQTELDDEHPTDYHDSYPVTNLAIEKMNELLEAVELVVGSFDKSEIVLLDL